MWKNESNQQTMNYTVVSNNWMKLNDPNSTIKSAKSWFLVTPAAFGRPSSLETSSFAETPALRWRPWPSPGCGRGESFPHSSDPPRSTDHLHSLMLCGGSTWNGVGHGIRWNMVELYFGGDYKRLPTRIWWKNMEKHGNTPNPSRPFRRFEETISFRISQALTIQQNALSEIKDGTIFTTERG